MEQSAPTQKRIILGISALIFIAGAGAWWYMHQPTPPLALVAGDKVVSWDFKGSHGDGGELQKRVRAEIARLESLLQNEKGEPTDYELYVSIANQYTLLGDGANAYEYLGKALSIDSEKTGLAWYNMGTLLERLGAPLTARIAYTKAVDAQSHIEQYHLARLSLLTKYFPDDTAAIEANFAQAETQLGPLPSILQMKAAWLKEKKI